MRRLDCWPSAVHKKDIPVIWPDKENILPPNIKVIDPSLPLDKAMYAAVQSLTESPINTSIVFPEIINDHEMEILKAERFREFRDSFLMDYDSTQGQKKALSDHFGHSSSKDKRGLFALNPEICMLLQEKIFTVLDALEAAFPDTRGKPALRADQEDQALTINYPHFDLNLKETDGYDTWYRLVFNFLWPGTEVYGNEDVIDSPDDEISEHGGKKVELKPDALPFMVPPGSIAFIGSTLPHQPSAHNKGTSSDIICKEDRISFIETVAPFPLDFT